MLSALTFEIRLRLKESKLKKSLGFLPVKTSTFGLEPIQRQQMRNIMMLFLQNCFSRLELHFEVKFVKTSQESDEVPTESVQQKLSRAISFH